jgi:hypothetical protein
VVASLRFTVAIPQTRLWSDMREDHYIPASFLGGFGADTKSTKGRRRARVAVRFRDSPDEVEVATADEIAKAVGIYKLQSPPMGLSPDAVDRAWRSYEPALPGSIRAVERNCYELHDIRTIALHMAAQGVRHPDFFQEAQKYLATQGAPVSDVDLPQLQRIRTMSDSLKMLWSQAKMAFLFPAAGAHKFVVNDKGFIKLWEIESCRNGIFFPLSSSLTALIVFDSIKPNENNNNGKPTPRLVVTPRAVDMLNEISWRQQGNRFVVGHPDDKPWIARLDDSRDLRPPLLGPYRGARGGFFDWAES